MYFFGESMKMEYFFIFSICSTILEETEWKYMSIISFNSTDIQLSQEFIQHFHIQVGPIVLTELKNSTASSSRATLLICGNLENLHRSVSENPSIWSPDTFYIVLLRNTGPECGEVLKDIWKKHFVIHVLIVTLNDPAKIMSYNPFFDTITETKIDVHNISKTLKQIRQVNRKIMSNLNGYPIRVTMFPTRLKAVPQPDGTYKGYDGILLQILAKRLNFTPIMTVPKDGHKYGWKENDTFTGALGEIIYGKADIAFNGVFIKHYHSNNIEFTTPVHFDQVCFIVPKAQTKPKWKTIFLTFDLHTWICLLLAYWVTFAAWYLLKMIDSEGYFDVSLLGLNLYRILLMTPINRCPIKCSERTLLAAVLFLGFVVASSFQGSMVTFLTYERYERDIRTIEELAESKLPIMSASLNLKELIETDENPVMLRLLSRFSWLENKDILGEMALNRNASAIGRKSDMEEKIATSYVKGDQILLHIVEQCTRSYHIAYLLPKKSPYLTSINNIINNLVESGITRSWFIHSKPFRPLSDYHHTASVQETHVIFTIENVIIAFLILIFGLDFSLVAFICEFFIHLYRSKKIQSYK